MNSNDISAPRVIRIEVHYEDGSKDVMLTAPPYHTKIPLFFWSRTSISAIFDQLAYTSAEVATMLFKTALTRRLMDHRTRDKDSAALTIAFGRTWRDADYPPPATTAQAG